ncbi:MAG: NmrA family NAD(P)-binding protein [Thermoflavifilum sp.]|uniref:NmrA family NAD(P)-binding protein n=1 Tax=Thermoflavifilum sp. TaxID=1968839 RepID=UPI0018A53AA7|nr:NAD(P)H-binding protein [Thermoflavifilum sp.]QOR75562.1 MAG: NmrA family NAD(P)-binding protein [Thermoflavifilum sp.]
MKIVVTGSLGYISKPLTQALVKNGHAVTVISRKAEKQKDIESVGAKPAIGSIQDVGFLTSTFSQSDIVYLMSPPVNFFDQNVDIEKYWTNIAHAYVQAVQHSGVTQVIHLSSIGAHTHKGVGMLAVHHHVENILKELPEKVSIKFMRPVGFYYNMFAFIPTIKGANAIIQNYGGDEKQPWVSPSDIAKVIADEMEKPFLGRTIRYIASDEVSPNEVANVLGDAIGKSDLKWLVISDEEFFNNLISIGFNPVAAKGMTEMNAARKKHLYDDYYQHKPVLGDIKLSDFAKEFAVVYSQR